MTELTIRPTRIEWGLYREQYETLVEALREEGYSVRLVLPNEVEERFGIPDLPPAAEAVSMYVGVRVADEVVRSLVRLAIERLRTRTKRERSGVLYGPDAEVLRRFEIPPEERE